MGAPASGIIAEAVLTPWDKDLEPETWTRALPSRGKTGTFLAVKQRENKEKVREDESGIRREEKPEARIRNPSAMLADLYQPIALIEQVYKRDKLRKQTCAQGCV